MTIPFLKLKVSTGRPCTFPTRQLRCWEAQIFVRRTRRHWKKLLRSCWAVGLLGPSRARYTPVGQQRATNEKEIILCNLVARREDVVNLGGFNEALYPNEENALMDQLQAGGGLL